MMEKVTRFVIILSKTRLQVELHGKWCLNILLGGNMAEPNDDKTSREYRLVLLGKTGSGKSTTANVICDQEVFCSSVSESSVTKTCQYAETCRFGYELSIVDTPGSFDTATANDVIMKEVTRCLALSAPGPHVFIYVFNALSRFTKEEEDSINQFVENFGERVFDYMMVIFTRYDDLQRCSTSPTKYLSNISPKFKAFLNNCKWRICWFDNTLSGLGANKQVQSLLSMVARTVEENGCMGYYTNALYTEAEKMMKQKEEELLKDQRENENEMRVLRIREEHIQKEKGSKEWRLKDIERRLQELEHSAEGKRVTRNSRNSKTLSKRDSAEPNLEREVTFLKIEMAKIKDKDLVKIEKQHEHIKEKRARLARRHHRANPRSMARKELSKKNSSFSNLICKGIAALGKHLLAGVIGLLLL